MKSRRFAASGGNGEAGFTLVEVLAAVAITSALMVLSANALRIYTLRQSLPRSVDQIATQLANMQATSVAESNPILFGAWFDQTPASQSVGVWVPIRFNARNPAITADDVCTATARARPGGLVGFNLPSDVIISEVVFQEVPGSRPNDVCRAFLGANAQAGEIVFFYPRGSATPGHLILEQPRLDDYNTRIDVTAITGRVIVEEE